MQFKKMNYLEKNIEAFNRIKRFMDECDEDYFDTDQRASVISLLEDLGVEIDACGICGAQPMNTNCNNAGCDV